MTSPTMGGMNMLGPMGPVGSMGPMGSVGLLGPGGQMSPMAIPQMFFLPQWNQREWEGMPMKKQDGQQNQRN